MSFEQKSTSWYFQLKQIPNFHIASTNMDLIKLYYGTPKQKKIKDEKKDEKKKDERKNNNNPKAVKLI